MTHRQRKLDCLGLAALLLASVVSAQTPKPQALQDVDSIRASAAAFVRERLRAPGPALLHAEAGVLDPRLRLPACGQTPRAFSPTGELRVASRLTIGVRCDSPAWTVYVPVNVESELAVLVTTRALPRNATVTAQDVDSQQRRVSGMATDYLTSVDQLAGRHLRNATAPGTALGADLLSPDVLIRRGQRVTLIATDAQPDGHVRVLNLNSRRIVEGQVESRDSVRISL
jgi:flagellar basal body P-ring formation protein FlgA